MKRVFVFIFTLLLFGSTACTETVTTEEMTVASITPPSGSPMYMAGQVEWIAKTFSPDCRIKKTDVVMTGG
jgi:hypothetical protein